MAVTAGVSAGRVISADRAIAATREDLNVRSVALFLWMCRIMNLMVVVTCLSGGTDVYIFTQI